MELVKELSHLDSDDDEAKKIEKTKENQSSVKLTDKQLKKKAKNDYSKYLPTAVLSFARLEIFFIIYKYHCPLNLVHLFWLLLTFLIEDDNVFLISMYAMLPLLFWEFLFIYGIRIPVVKDTEFM